MHFPVVLATGNADKAREIREIFAARLDRPLAAAALMAGDGTTIGYLLAPVESVSDAVSKISFPDDAPDVEEIGTTLHDNALIKARGVGAALNTATIADDTGLEVDALGGAPGVYSARYAGPHATYADNCHKLVAELAGVEPPRAARFTTVACYWRPDAEPAYATGRVEGSIGDDSRGDGGFGYDPVFVPSEGNGRTFAEMTPSEKHALSHRGRAFRAFAESLMAN